MHPIVFCLAGLAVCCFAGAILLGMAAYRMNDLENKLKKKEEDEDQCSS